MDHCLGSHAADAVFGLHSNAESLASEEYCPLLVTLTSNNIVDGIPLELSQQFLVLDPVKVSQVNNIQSNSNAVLFEVPRCSTRCFLFQQRGICL